MGSWIKSNLGKNENVVYEAKVTLWPIVYWFVLGLVLSIPTYFIGTIICWLVALKRVFDYFFTELAMTNKRVIA